MRVHASGFSCQHKTQFHLTGNRRWLVIELKVSDRDTGTQREAPIPSPNMEVVSHGLSSNRIKTAINLGACQTLVGTLGR